MEAWEYEWEQLDRLVPSQTPKMVRHLGVIGNGLDLAVGLPSRFSDFRSYFAGRSEDLSDLGYQFAAQVFAHVDGLADQHWSNFEDVLARVALPDDVANREWADSGDLQELDDLLIEAENYKVDFRRELTDAFSAWITEQVEPSSPRRKPPIVAQLVSACDAFLTFNYTKTLEDYLGVENNRVLHIHGTALEGGGPYFGCPVGSISGEAGGANGLYQSIRDRVQQDLVDNLVKTPRVELLEKFLQNAGPLPRVSSYGFSFGDADEDYVRAIIGKCDGDTLWTQHCFASPGEDLASTASAERCCDVLDRLLFPGSLVFEQA